MSVKLYDDAVTEKIKNWILDPKLMLLKPDETSRLFRLTADMHNDRPLTLPLISISRDRDIEIKELRKQPKSFSGVILESNENTTMSLNVIPIRISYQLDIYTRNIEEADEYVRNFVFNLINKPQLKVTIPYNNVNLEQVCYINLVDTISDNSDIEEKLFPDQFQRFTIKFIIDDAYLFSVPITKNAKIVNAELDILDRHTQKVIESSKIF